jgi:4-oxalocrotonate tautomerase
MPFINVKMLSGRSQEQKRELAEVITKEVVRILKIKPEVVEVVIDEYPPQNWASAGKLYSDQ